MKKGTKLLTNLVFVMSLALILAACSSSGDRQEAEVAYKDGTYYGEGEHWEHGYEAAEVTIEDGKITKIVLKRMTTDGQEVNYDEWIGEDGRPNLKQFREDMAQEMIKKQTYDVDVIATATKTSEGWKEAVKNALEQAK